MTPSTPSSNEAKPQRAWGASISGRDPESLLESTSRSAPAARPNLFDHDFYASHERLLQELDEAFEKHGILDPQTWILIDAQILDCLEQHLLSVGQYLQLHGHIENRLRLAGGGWG